MRTLRNMLVMFVLAVLMAFPSHAATAWDIADRDSNISFNGREFTISNVRADNNYRANIDSISNATRTCSGYEIGTFLFDENDNTAAVSTDAVNTIVLRTTIVDNFVREKVPTLVSNGMSKNDALHTLFEYLSKNYIYDYDIVNMSEDKQAEYADAYTLFDSGKGVCIAFSYAYRALVEAVPFENGVVNWNSQNPTHLKVATVENGVHMWNAIQEDDGNWYIYDAAYAACSPNSLDNFFKITGGESYDFKEKVWHY